MVGYGSMQADKVLEKESYMLICRQQKEKLCAIPAVAWAYIRLQSLPPTRHYLLIVPFPWAKHSNIRVCGSHTYSNYHTGVGVALLAEVSVGMGFEVSEAQARPSGSILFLLPANPDVKLSAPFPTRCLSTSPMSHHDDDGLNLCTVSQPHLNVFLYTSCHKYGVSQQ